MTQTLLKYKRNSNNRNMLSTDKKLPSNIWKFFLQTHKGEKYARGKTRENYY